MLLLELYSKYSRHNTATVQVWWSRLLYAVEVICVCPDQAIVRLVLADFVKRKLVFQGATESRISAKVHVLSWRSRCFPCMISNDYLVLVSTVKAKVARCKYCTLLTPTTNALRNAYLKQLHAL